MKKRCIFILKSIFEFIDYYFNFNQRIVLILITGILLTTNTREIIQYVIFLNILNILMDWIYKVLKNKEFQEKKVEVFDILDKWFSKRKNIEVFEINNLIYVILGGECNYYNIIVEFKNLKGHIKWHNRINELLKEMDEKMNYRYLDNKEFHNIYDLNKYIEINCEKDKDYLKSNINNLVTSLIDKKIYIDKINSIKKDSFKSLIISILLAFFATDLKEFIIKIASTMLLRN